MSKRLFFKLFENHGYCDIAYKYVSKIIYNAIFDVVATDYKYFVVMRDGGAEEARRRWIYTIINLFINF